jgi:DNA-binding NarL/FixJ family response regulator
MTPDAQIAAVSASDGATRRTRTTRVAIATAHAGVRGALRTLVDLEPGLQIVATVGDDRGAARCLLQHHPDVLLLALPGALRDGGAPVRSLRLLSPQTAVVVLGTTATDPYRSVARAAGAAALVALDGPSDALLDAVRVAATPPQ